MKQNKFKDFAGSVINPNTAMTKGNGFYLLWILAIVVMKIFAMLIGMTFQIYPMEVLFKSTDNRSALFIWIGFIFLFAIAASSYIYMSIRNKVYSKNWLCLVYVGIYILLSYLYALNGAIFSKPEYIGGELTIDTSVWVILIDILLIAVQLTIGIWHFINVTRKLPKHKIASDNNMIIEDVISDGEPESQPSANSPQTFKEEDDSAKTYVNNDNEIRPSKREAFNWYNDKSTICKNKKSNLLWHISYYMTILMGFAISCYCTLVGFEKNIIKGIDSHYMYVYILVALFVLFLASAIVFVYISNKEQVFPNGHSSFMLVWFNIVILILVCVVAYLETTYDPATGKMTFEHTLIFYDTLLLFVKVLFLANISIRLELKMKAASKEKDSKKEVEEENSEQ